MWIWCWTELVNSDIPILIFLENMFVITVGSGNSGCGAVHDYLKSRNDFSAPFFGQEFRLINDPDGIDNLYLNFYENFTINNAASAFERFKLYSNQLAKSKPYINGKRKSLFNDEAKLLINDYITKVACLEYYAMPQHKYLSLNIIKKLVFYFKYKLFNEKINNIRLYKILLPVREKNFLDETRKFIYKLCKKNSYLKKNIVLDQSASYWRPDRYFKYFKNLKIIIINRDPRSIYYSMSSRNSKAYPSDSVKKFCIWYKYIRSKQLKTKNKNIYIIQYEKFVNNFETESKKLNNFLNIKNINSTSFDLSYSKKNVYKAKFQLGKSDQLYIKKNLKNFLYW